MSRFFESRLIWGGLLILGGVVLLLQNLGIIRFGGLFWAFILGLAGLFFITIFTGSRANWWALIPGFTLLSVSLLIVLDQFAPAFSSQIGGSIVLGGIGASFLTIYAVERENWWALIPSGVLLTLALVAGLDNLVSWAGGGVFFLGLGLTFALVALIPSRQGELRWAWIPAGVLFVMGALLLASEANLINTLWPAFLILAGAFLLLRTFLRR